MTSINVLSFRFSCVEGMDIYVNLDDLPAGNDSTLTHPLLGYAGARISSSNAVPYNVSVALSGHDHFYERIEPQRGIVYFVVGSGGQLARGDIDKRSALTAKGFDTDQVFMAVEIVGDKMYVNVISRHGQIVESGIIARRMPAGSDSAATAAN